MLSTENMWEECTNRYQKKSRERWDEEIAQVWDAEETQAIVCAEFACPAHLTLLEALCGRYCQKHSIQEPRPDPTKFVSY